VPEGNLQRPLMDWYDNFITPRRTPMSLSEESMRFLEEQIPELAEAAVRQAYWDALNAGNSVLEYEDGALVEVFPDGTRTRIKQLPEQRKVTPGQTFKLQ
jgi:hypothetical protein